MNIKEEVINYFVEKDKDNKINRDSILTFNYVESHFFTSIEFIEMIADFEQNFLVTFSDEHLKSNEFAMIGGLIKLIEQSSLETA